MSETTQRYQVSIGAVSLILIFIVMCMASFAVLSLSSAAGDRSMARRGAAAVQDYYRADALGKEMTAQAQRGADAAAAGFTQTEEGFAADVAMNYGQSLHIELTPSGEGGRPYVVTGWYVYDSGELAIDQSMPVWNGGEGGN